MIFVAAIHTRLHHCRKLLKLYYAVRAKAFALGEKVAAKPTDEGGQIQILYCLFSNYVIARSERRVVEISLCRVNRFDFPTK